MCLTVEATIEQNHLPTLCSLCGRTTGSRTAPNVRFILYDEDQELGDVCERCAYGSTDVWRLTLSEYAARLESKAAFLRALAGRVKDGIPVSEGIIEDLMREQAQRPRRPKPPFLPPRGD